MLFKSLEHAHFLFPLIELSRQRAGSHESWWCVSESKRLIRAGCYDSCVWVCGCVWELVCVWEYLVTEENNHSFRKKYQKMIHLVNKVCSFAFGMNLMEA